MKIIAIAASPRRHGNSETLVDQALAGAREKGAKTEKIILGSLDIEPCHGSDTCQKHARCFVRDDMPGLLEKINKANGIIIASPVYFGSITSQLKTMIDRCQPLWVGKYILKRKRPMQKRGAFLCVGSHNNRKFFRNSKEIVEILFRVLDIDCTEELYFPGLESKDDAKGNDVFLKRAFRCGKKIAEA
jgi:multimeric flavodoxin WrbA